MREDYSALTFSQDFLKDLKMKSAFLLLLLAVCVASVQHQNNLPMKVNLLHGTQNKYCAMLYSLHRILKLRKN